MFINNDYAKRWVNGSLGEVVDYREGYDDEAETSYTILKIKLENGKTVEVSPYTWSISKYLFKGNRFVREEIGSFTQIPLRLAWAITIHKSQGKTFDRVKIDLGARSFAHGQTYVALSRCRTLENVKLQRPIRREDILIDNLVSEYYQQF
jgi:ATP-dependent exoDNAse (exonuclease V) alpha subunit